MARIPFGRLKDTEIRKPSKVLLVLMILFILLLALSATFIVLYLKEKTKSTGQSGTCSSTACVSSAAGMYKGLFPLSGLGGRKRNHHALRYGQNESYQEGSWFSFYQIF